FRSALSSTCTTASSCAMRFTERNETPLMRATSVLRWPAFSKTSTSCRFSIPHILLSSDSRLGLEYKDFLSFVGLVRRARISGIRRAKIYGTDTPLDQVTLAFLNPLLQFPLLMFERQLLKAAPLIRSHESFV